MDTSGLAFPKPGKKQKKVTREQDPHYVWWIHGWECCVPGCVTPWPVHAHHAVRRSQGGSDRSCVPLCHNHHIGDQGIHIRGVLTFEKVYRINLLQKSYWYNEAYALAKVGPKQDLLPAFGSVGLGSS
jgi:hypothetical protein